MRIFDYYRQFEELPPDAVSRERLERRDEARAREVVFVPELDLARTAWHEPPPVSYTHLTLPTTPYV